MFKCDKCGLCCRNQKGVSLYADLDRGDGVCKHLEGNLCSIYNDRPVLCRVDDCYDKFFKYILTKEQYYELNNKICNNLKQNNYVSSNIK